MPNKENIRTWYDALNSKLYPQTTGELHNDEGYCCLGVGSEKAAEAGVCSVEALDGGSFWYDGQAAYFAESVAEWFGLEPRPYVKVLINGEALKVTLDELNDCYKWDFDQIAEVIRENYLSD